MVLGAAEARPGQATVVKDDQSNPNLSRPELYPNVQLAPSTNELHCRTAAQKTWPYDEE